MRQFENLLNFSKSRFQLWLGVLCLSYLGLQLVYIHHLPLIMDEFAGMDTVLKHRDGIPYLDFMPYKTVLGYYIQLIPTYFTNDVWQRLIFSKIFLAITNTIVIYWVSLRLNKHFSTKSVLGAVLLLICMSTFLERSSELRVDMMTSLFGLLGLVYLLERRILLAGILNGLALLISQKAAYFVLASGSVLVIEFIQGTDRRQSLHDIVLFGIATFLPLSIYLGIFSLIASPEIVIRQVFLGPSTAAFKTDYYSRMDRYWFQTIYRNPLFWSLSLISLLALIRYRNERIALTLAAYGTVMFALCLWHKQPWPYFFVLLIPTCFVLIIACFDKLSLPSRAVSLGAGMLVLTTGVAFPLTRIPSNLIRDNGFQRYSIETAEQLLNDDETYLAGVNIIPSRQHAPHSMIWLDKPRLQKLKQRKYYVDLIAEMKTAKVKLVLQNYRLNNLPEPLDTYIKENYLPLTGNLMIYAPTISMQAANFHLLFSGEYLLLNSDSNEIIIDGKTVTRGSLVTLNMGDHYLENNHTFRLKLHTPTLSLPKQTNYFYTQSFFPNVYTY